MNITHFSYSYEKCYHDKDVLLFDSLNERSFFSQVRINLKCKSITVYSLFKNELFNFFFNQGIIGQFVDSNDRAAFRIKNTQEIQKLCQILLENSTFPERWLLLLRILETEGRWAIKQNDIRIKSYKLE